MSLKRFGSLVILVLCAGAIGIAVFMVYSQYNQVERIRQEWEHVNRRVTSLEQKIEVASFQINDLQNRLEVYEQVERQQTMYEEGLVMFLGEWEQLYTSTPLAWDEVTGGAVFPAETYSGVWHEEENWYVEAKPGDIVYFNIVSVQLDERIPEMFGEMLCIVVNVYNNASREFDTVYFPCINAIRFSKNH